MVGKPDVNIEVDLDQYPNARSLVEACKKFFAEIEDL